MAQDNLLDRYNCGPVKFSGGDNARYERHLTFDQVIPVSSAKCYRPADFPSDRARVEYLFQLYEQLTAPLAPTAKPKRVQKASN